MLTSSTSGPGTRSTACACSTGGTGRSHQMVTSSPCIVPLAWVTSSAAGLSSGAARVNLKSPSRAVPAVMFSVIHGRVLPPQAAGHSAGRSAKSAWSKVSSN